MAVDARLMEKWLRMLADGVRGAEDARQALESLGAVAPSGPNLVDWMAAWMPRTAATAPMDEQSLDEFRAMVMESWSAMGVVPRYEYARLLKRHEELTARLEEAEETVRKLRTLLRAQETSEEAERMLDSWDRMTRRALDAQTEWTRTWMDVFGTAESNGKE